MSRIEIITLSAMTTLSVLILAALGRLTPEITHDTAGYLQFASFSGGILAQPRLPFYGWLLSILDFGSGTYVAVPAFQITVFVLASWLLVAQLRAYGLSAAASLSVGAALLSANALFMYSGWVHPELPAVACALLAFAGTVHLAGPRPRWWGWLLACAGAGCAYSLRPNFLPLIAVLPALLLGLNAVRSDALRPMRAATVFLLSASPFMGIASLRAATLGDFNVVSFGGFVMSGMATLMLSDDVVERLPEDVKPFAAQVLSARRAAEDSGRIIGIPINASQIRSYSSVTLAYFDVLARTHDDILYGIIVPTQGANESWVDFNRRLMRFSLAVMRAAPDRYVMWVIGGSTRMLGRSFMTNLPAVLAISVVVVAWPWRLFVRRQIGVRPVSRLDFPVLILCAILWLVGAGLLTILVHAPATRFIETASLLVAPALIYWAALLLMGESSRRS